jgi:hypothetical protein
MPHHAFPLAARPGSAQADNAALHDCIGMQEIARESIRQLLVFRDFFTTGDA